MWKYIFITGLSVYIVKLFMLSRSFNIDNCQDHCVTFSVMSKCLHSIFSYSIFAFAKNEVQNALQEENV